MQFLSYMFLQPRWLLISDEFEYPTDDIRQFDARDIVVDRAGKMTHCVLDDYFGAELLSENLAEFQINKGVVIGMN